MHDTTWVCRSMVCRSTTILLCDLSTASAYEGRVDGRTLLCRMDITRNEGTRAVKQCAECEELFIPRQKDQRYCCPECRRIGHNARLNYDKAVALRLYRYMQQNIPNTLSKILASI